MDINDVYIIPALGRSISLGSLYDAGNERFTMTSILNRKKIDEVVEIRDVPSTLCELTSTDSYEEKFQKMNINGKLKLSFLSDTINGTNTLNFLNEEKKSNKILRTTLIYKVRTKIETLQISNERMRKFITDNLECETNATHFVTEIKWGANVFATFEIKNNENVNKDNFKTNTEVEFSKNLKQLAGLLNATVKLGSSSKFNSNENFTNLKINFESDVSISTLPQNMEDVVNILKKIPDEIKRYNNEKGIQIEYILKPIEYINLKFKKSLKISKCISKIDEVIINRVEYIFDHIRILQGDFNDFIEELNSINEAIGSEDSNNVKTAYSNFCIESAKFKSELREKWLKIRKGEENEEALHKILDEFNIQIMKIQNRVVNFQVMRDKIDVSKELKKLGFVHLRADVNETVLLRTPNMFIFYSKSNDTNNIPCLQILKKLMSMGDYKSCTFYIYDLNINKTLGTNNDEMVKIKYYKDGILQYDGFVDDEELLLIKLKRNYMMSFDEQLKNFVYDSEFSAKYRIKTCKYFKYEIDRDAIDYHITFCTENYSKVPRKIWEEIFNNNNDNKKNWPSIFRKEEKTDRDNEIIRKFFGRWRRDHFYSPVLGFVTRNLPDKMGLWRWDFYARIFFSFDNRDNLREYLDEYPDLLPEPGFVIYYRKDTYKSFDMED